MPNVKAKTTNQAPRKRTRTGGKGRKRTKTNNSGLSALPTTGNVQNKLRASQPGQMLAKPSPHAYIDNNYIHCKFDPLNSGTSLGLPDDTSIRRIVSDIRTFVDFTIPANGELQLKITPTLPWAGWAKPLTPDVAYNIEGVTLNHKAPAINSNVYYPIGRMNRLTPNGFFVIGGSNPNTYNATKARIITVGWRLVYTGAASTCSGTITVNENSIGVTGDSPNTNALGLLSGADALTLATTVGPGSAMERRIEFSRDLGLVAKDTVTARPETALKGLLKHVGPYQWRTMSDYGELLVDATTGGPSNVASSMVLATPTSYGLYYMIDPDYTSTDIRIATGINPGSYRLECVHCVEFQIHPDSVLYDMTPPPPKPDPMAIQASDAAIRRLPPAMPTTEHESWVTSTMRTITNIANSPAAIAIANITRMIAAL